MEFRLSVKYRIRCVWRLGSACASRKIFSHYFVFVLLFRTLFCGSEGNTTYIELFVALGNLKANSPPTHAG